MFLYAIFLTILFLQLIKKVGSELAKAGLF